MHLLPFLPILVLPTTVLAWGALGHRTVAYLAQKHFSPAAHTLVDALLVNEHGWDISDAVLWPDGGVKRRRPETAQWHFIDARDDPPNWCGVNYTRDCTHDGTPACVVSAIKNVTKLLLVSSPTFPPMNTTSRKESLMFLMHFLGDIHQPLHTEYLQRGGNNINVCFDKSCGRVNLHSVWDTYIPHKHRNLSYHAPGVEAEKETAKTWAADLWNTTHGEDRRDESAIGLGEECVDITDPERCAIAWANDSNALVCSYVLAPGEEWLRKNDLAGKYFDGAVKPIEQMIGSAGKRLGAWVNAIAGELEVASVEGQDDEQDEDEELERLIIQEL